jgi:hypothetical protein
MEKEMESKLKAFFKPEELEWRIQSSGFTSGGEPWAKVLCYVQARAVQDRLDDVFGIFGWKDTYRRDNKSFICSLSVYDNTKKEWITKENGSDETNIEATKGGISGAFKRVASSGYGIGRYLYKLDTVFAVCQVQKPNDKKGWNYANVKVKENEKDVYKKFFWQNPTLNPEFLPTKEDKK